MNIGIWLLAWVWGRLMDIAAWLRGLGFERYEAAFRENEID